MMAQSRNEQILQAYEIIGERFASIALDGLYTDYYERPVMYALLGDVKGCLVLDTACGPGSTSMWLVERGAEVIAFDLSPTMVQLAQKKLGNAVLVRQADLNQPLDFFDDGSVDKVLCALALDYIKDWDGLFAEFNHLLVPHGQFVFSVHHPFFLDLKVEADIQEDYFSIQEVDEDWLVFGLKIPAFRRPLEAISASLWEAGFCIEQIIEPKPTEEAKAAFPEAYEQLSKHPVFLCVSARKIE